MTATEQTSGGTVAVRAWEPQRALVLSDDDRKTVFSLITAQLGEQGLTVTRDEFAYFLRVAELRGLNPLFREVHLIKDRSGRINVQTGIDGFRKLAEDTGEYLGQTEATWGSPLPDDYPIAEWRGKPSSCRVGVYRKGWDAPLYGEAWLDEDGATGDDWQGDGLNRRKVGRKANAQWAQRPRTMLKKVAEARAIRAAFPRQTAGLYTDDELHRGEVVEGAAVEVTTPKVIDPAQAAVTATDAPGAAEPPEVDADATAEGTWLPDPAPATVGLQGVVEKAPDGIRMSKITSHGYAGRVVEKLEVVVRVNNRRHTLMLLEGLALGAHELDIRAGDAVRVHGGQLEEIEWQAGKPKKKEWWGATGLDVERGGVWVPARIVTDGPAAAEAAPEPAAAAKLDRTNDEVVTLRARLTEPLSFTESRGRNVAILKAADLATGELLGCVLGDEPPGEIEAQLGTADEPFVKPGDEVTLMGVWRNEWIILTAVGR